MLPLKDASNWFPYVLYMCPMLHVCAMVIFVEWVIPTGYRDGHQFIIYLLYYHWPKIVDISCVPVVDN